MINCLITLKTLINKLSDGCHREDSNASTQQRVSPTCLHLFSTYCLMGFLQSRSTDVFLLVSDEEERLVSCRKLFQPPVKEHQPQTKYLWPLMCQICVLKCLQNKIKLKKRSFKVEKVCRMMLETASKWPLFKLIHHTLQKSAEQSLTALAASISFHSFTLQILAPSLQEIIFHHQAPEINLS